MSDQTNHRRNRLKLIVVLCAALAHGAPTQGQQALRISPPFSGTYRLTAYFDHHFPNYAADPDGRVTVYTGEQVANCSPYCYRGHSGYDWSMPAGTPVRAAADGVVEGVVESSTGYGNRVVIRHDDGHRTIYAHLREHRPAQGAPAFNVVVSQSVRAGDVIRVEREHRQFLWRPSALWGVSRPMPAQRRPHLRTQCDRSFWLERQRA